MHHKGFIMIKITEVKVYPVKIQDKEKRLKAYATIVFENSFIVRDLKVILGNDGQCFVSMPSRRSKFGSFRDIAHPLNSEMRNSIEKSVIEEYERVKNSETTDSSYDIE
jgi:stage V sporulation protein G